MTYLVLTTTDLLSNTIRSVKDTLVNKLGLIKNFLVSSNLVVNGSETNTILVQDISSALVFLTISTIAAETDRYDIEFYDGDLSGKLIYRAQQLNGSYEDNLVFYHLFETTKLTLRIINLRTDAVPINITVSVKYSKSI